MALRVIENRQLLQILVMFMIVQFSGLFLAAEVFSGATYAQVQSVQVVSSPSGALLLIAYIIAFTAGIVLLLRIYKGDRLFLVLEGAVLFISSFFVFLILFGIVDSTVLFYAYGTAVTVNFVAAAGAAAALVAAKNKWQRLRNTAAIIASIGVGVVLGISFGFYAAFIFMMILALYDFIAVFVTKHMVSMAKAMSGRNLAFLIGVNEVEALPQSRFSKRELEEYERDRKEVEKRSKVFSKLYREGLVPVAARVELGTGDLAVPLMVAVAAYKLSLNFLLSFFIVFGAVLGLVVTTMILRRYNRALPAIPPLLFGIVLSMLAYMGFVGLIHL